MLCRVVRGGYAFDVVLVVGRGHGRLGQQRHAVLLVEDVVVRGVFVGLVVVEEQDLSVCVLLDAAGAALQVVPAVAIIC